MSQPRSRREFLALTPGALAIALGVGAATGSTGPAGSSASIGPGTTNKIAKFLSSNTIGNSALTDDGTNVTTTEDIIPSADSARILGAAALRWDRGYISRIIGSSNARLLKLFSLNIDSGNLDLTLKTNQTVVPNSDNALDFGNAGQRWRNGYFSGNLKARSKNVLVLDGQSMTQSSHTV